MDRGNPPPSPSVPPPSMPSGEAGVKPDNDSWKEQLGFISGTVLLWALVLIRLLPLAAGIQLPNGIQYVDPRGYADINLPSYSLLTVLGALGITGFLVGVVHMSARGLWLASPTERLNRLSQRTYRSVFTIAKYALGLLTAYPILFAVVGLQRGVHRLLSVESRVVGIVLYFVVILAVLAVVLAPLAIWTWRVARAETAETLWARLKALYRRIEPFMDDFLESFPIIMLFVILTNVTFYLSYKADLSVSKTIYGKTIPGADVHVQLGGMTSDFTKLHLTLVNTNGTPIREVILFDLGGGKYAARIDLTGFSPDRYGIRLEYPYPDVSLVPFRVHSKVRREQWFLVAN